MGKMKAYWQDQQELKYMYDFNLQADLMKRVENAIATKQARTAEQTKQTKKTEESCSQGFTSKPVVQAKSTT